MVGPAPSAWTLAIAKHMKALAPRTLVMDGSLARLNDRNKCWPVECLKSPDIDLFSYHYYGNGDIGRVEKDVAFVLQYKKV